MTKHVEQLGLVASWIAWIGVVALSACVTTPTSNGIEPALGHSQPLPVGADPNGGHEQPAEILPNPANSAVDDFEQTASPDAVSSVVSDLPSGPTIPPPEPVNEEDELLCRHITGIVLAESGNVAKLNADEIDELTASCSVALAQDRRQLDAREFRRRADCVRAADSVAGFAACQPAPSSN